MTIGVRRTTVLGCALILGCLPAATAQNQPNDSKPKTAEYKSGQVWTVGQGITVTVLAVEDLHKIGKVIHVRVDKIPLQTCGDLHLTRTIEHLALTEKMMRKSRLDLLQDSVDLPESSVDAYRKWEEQKKHDVAKVTIQEAIPPVPGPMICNFAPSQT
jgi:hypothetical protein